MFDITIFPLTVDAGREQYELPGFHIASAPRKASRLRAQDKLILYYRLSNLSGVPQPAAFSHSQQEDIFKGLVETYFTTPGSVTAGLRAVVSQFNEFLFHRNRKNGAGEQLFGVMNIVALHGDSLIVAHGGPAHSFLLGSKGAAHYDDSVSGGRGLGLAGQVVPRFYQSTLEPGNLLILSSDAPASWNTKILADGAKLPFDQLRRRLVTDAAADVRAAVIRFQPGKGQVTYWRPTERPSASDSRPSRPVVQAPRAPVQTPGPAPLPAVSTGDQNLAASIQPVVQAEENLASSPVEFQPEPGEPVIAAGPAAIYDLPSSPADQDLGDEIEPVKGIELPAETVDFSSSSADETPSGTIAPEDGHSMQKPGVFIGEASAKENASSPVPRPAHRGSQPVPTASDAAAPVEQQSERSPAEPSVREKRTSHKPVEVKTGLFSRLRLAGHAENAGVPAKKSAPARVAAAAPAPVDSSTAGVPEAEPPAEPRSENLRRGLASAVRSGRKARAKVGRALPHQPFFNLSPGIMLSVAIVIPLIVVAVALTVYLRSGFSEKFAAKMLLAQQYVQQAQQQQDPIQQRDAWKQAYILVNDALNYEPNNQPALDLRREALVSIDNLEGYVRLDYQPLRDGLGSNVKITRMVATLTGVYLLDSNQGRVYRLQPTSSGYSVDPSFNCGPGKAGSQIITQLIDLAELPVNNELHADILAIDSGGSLVYCSSGAEGFDSQPLPLPDNGWGKITAITSLGDSLFVLDPKGNAVYRYDGENGIFTAGPHLYFDEDIPQMADVIDLAVDQEFLYLLHQNGQMTVCDSGGVSYAVTKCTDPTPYGDNRPGYEPSPLVFNGSQFTHIQATQPPDPALYALDVKNRSIYHLSLRLLNLQRQYLPQPVTDFPLPNAAPTAFIVTTNRRALLAFDNLIFFAPIP